MTARIIRAFTSQASWWFIAPSLLVLAIFLSGYFLLVKASLLHPLPGRFDGEGPLTLDNFERFLRTPSEWRVLLQTLKVSAGLTIAAILIGFPVSFAIVRAQTALRRFLIAAFVLTLLSGTVTRAYAWLIILGNKGVINGTLIRLGIIDSPIPMIYSNVAVSISLVHYILPFFVLTLIGALKNVPRALEESAVSLGASRLSAFWHVTLPLSLPGIVASSALSFSIAVSSFIFPLLLGGGRVRFVSNEIYDLIFVNFDLPMAATSAFIFLLTSLCAVWLFSTLQRFAGGRLHRQAH
ncbi:ABC transporter permease [Pandoraea sp. NPDC087047]|uniref:ABC transporter permease n=1 Tax=Pandoraea sp. NPDC087047 TaxID=3364390 RepID=UPI0038172251